MKGDQRMTCRHCGDEIAWNAEYEVYTGETNRCPKAPAPYFRHQPRLGEAAR